MYIKEQMYPSDFVFLCRPVHGVIIKKTLQSGKAIII